MTTFPSALPPPCATPATRPQRASKSQPSSSEAGTQLSDFFSNPQNPPHMLLVHDVIHILRSHFLSGVSIVTSLNDTSAQRTREQLRSCLHLTNPCSKQKVLSLTKPKGKIYKTKSLGHYIIAWELRNIEIRVMPIIAETLGTVPKSRDSRLG